MTLPEGITDVPGGRLATIVTCLDMHERPAPLPERDHADSTLARITSPDPEWYRTLFRRVGEEWLWYSRLRLPFDQLKAILHSADVEVYAFHRQDGGQGLLELDFRAAPDCELAFFGLTADARGRGSGRWLMNRAVERAWARPIRRFWVHTCTLDHPRALQFYVRSGFRPYARRVEIAPDPRLEGLLPASAAPHVPIIDR